MAVSGLAFILGALWLRDELGRLARSVESRSSEIVEEIKAAASRPTRTQVDAWILELRSRNPQITVPDFPR